MDQDLKCEIIMLVREIRQAEEKLKDFERQISEWFTADNDKANIMLKIEALKERINRKIKLIEIIQKTGI